MLRDTKTAFLASDSHDSEKFLIVVNILNIGRRCSTPFESMDVMNKTHKLFLELTDQCRKFCSFKRSNNALKRKGDKIA